MLVQLSTLLLLLQLLVVFQGRTGGLQVNSDYSDVVTRTTVAQVGIQPLRHKTHLPSVPPLA